MHKEYTQEKAGPIIDIETYQEIGQHIGSHFWTLGQGVRLAGRKKRYYVCQKEVTANQVYVCLGENHPALYCENFFTQQPYWISGAPPEELSDRSKDQV